MALNAGSSEPQGPPGRGWLPPFQPERGPPSLCAQPSPSTLSVLQAEWDARPHRRSHALQGMPGGGDVIRRPRIPTAGLGWSGSCMVRVLPRNSAQEAIFLSFGWPNIQNIDTVRKNSMKGSTHSFAQSFIHSVSNHGLSGVSEPGKVQPGDTLIKARSGTC